MEKNNAPQPHAPVPVMTDERFAELSGLSPDTVRGQLQQGNLPIYHIGRRRMVNVAPLVTECMQGEEF